jgi:hypothetical protein
MRSSIPSPRRSATTRRRGRSRRAGSEVAPEDDRAVLPSLEQGLARDPQALESRARSELLPRVAWGRPRRRVGSVAQERKERGQASPAETSCTRRPRTRRRQPFSSRPRLRIVWPDAPSYARRGRARASVLPRTRATEPSPGAARNVSASAERSEREGDPQHSVRRERLPVGWCSPVEIDAGPHRSHRPLTDSTGPADSGDSDAATTRAARGSRRRVSATSSSTASTSSASAAHCRSVARSPTRQRERAFERVSSGCSTAAAAATKPTDDEPRAAPAASAPRHGGGKFGEMRYVGAASGVTEILNEPEARNVAPGDARDQTQKRPAP